jgi:HD-GYP domain-containing protein (c-di-GMP phosphodiesterase class II)
MTEAVGDFHIGYAASAKAEAPDKPPRRSRRLRVPMQAAVAIGVMLLLGAVIAGLSWQAYRSSQQALISASADTIGYIRDAMAQKTRRILEPAEAQLHFLIRGPLSTAYTVTERLRLAPLMADALAKNELLDAIYAGYPDGEFVLYRSVRDAEVKKRLNAPQDATMVVQSITLRPDGRIVGEYRFFDAGNTLVEVRLDEAYRFDPRTRGWYRAAVNQSDLVLTDPYIFFTINEIGLTLAQRTIDAGAVIGLDLKLRTIAEQIERLRITPSAEVALVNRKDQVIGYKDSGKMVVRDWIGGPRLATVKELGVAPLLAAYDLNARGAGQLRATVDVDGRTWQAIQTNIDLTQSRTIKLLVAIPDDEFFSTARTLVWRQLQIAGIIMLVAILFAWWLTKLIVAPLRRLAGETARIERFDFSADERIGSRLNEIDDLGRALHRMKRTIRKFLNIGHALAAERDFRPLLERVLVETIDVVRSDGGAIFMLDDAQTAIIPETVRWVRQHAGDTAPGIAQGLHQGGIFARLNEAVRSREIVVADHKLEILEIAALGLADAVATLKTSRFAFVIVPLLDRVQAPFGILVLNKAIADQDPAWSIDDRLIRLIHAVSGSASVAIQNKLLLEAQRKLIDSLIKLVAGAIDAKSAYTGGHCQRVPALTRLLAEAAVAQQEGPYRDFALNEEEWEALDIAAWLHDCGKVTTPEYVVDKATKLETIYDRIHEVRTRFEVLKRDAEIAYWRGLAQGGDEPTLRREMETAKQALDDDFAFVAKSNEGGEFLEPEKIARIKAIGARRWTRTISNRLGVSYEEAARMRRQPEPPLPVEEPLLDDRDDHVSELSERDIIAADNPWGFALTVPKVKFNRGEVYNLCIARGTLTEEERYRINDHIVQTIIMLESLPFPKHLKNVPELAGGHHEKMDGTGYPKRLKGGDMSVVARIMAIADVFEALTAADRPYKKAKKLSEAVKIMGFMKKDHHLDPELLDLFLTSGVWRDYARRFLAPEQIDEPDIAGVLGIKPVARN